MKISVIIPTYNESQTIVKCLESLAKQTRETEIIVVDDGSTDDSYKIIEKFKESSLRQPADRTIKILRQSHNGPGAARNLAAKYAKGDILVFVDADMTFAPYFIEELVMPIEQGIAKGTFTKEEYVANWDNVWARCWNYNQGISDQRRIPENYPDKAPVFRAILKKEFRRVGGFTEGIGWTDDWSLSRKLGYRSTKTNAVCYHANPSDLKEVFNQARWIGKNEFLSGNGTKVLLNLYRYSFPISFAVAIIKALFYKTPNFVVFKLVYDFAISVSLIESLFSSNRNK